MNDAGSLATFNEEKLAARSIKSKHQFKYPGAFDNLIEHSNSRILKQKLNKFLNCNFVIKRL